MNRADALYQNLQMLTKSEDSPFYVVHHVGVFDSARYEVYSYLLASYTDFLQPDALECRGHMFRIENGNPVLASLPFKKFFNLGENPMTMDLDLSFENIDSIYYKEDGSLISTYLDGNGELRLKSKTALTSTMAIEAMSILPTIKKPFADRSLLEYCTALANDNKTVIMEYVSPKNRIVLPYEQCDLVVLGVRDNETFETWSTDDLRSTGLDIYCAENKEFEDAADFEAFFNSIPKMKGIEGYVVTLKDGTIFKKKTDEYVSLHHAKDSVTSPRRLMDVILNEASDDIKQMFKDDTQALREIENMEIFVSHLVAGLMKPVDAFYHKNSKLERKEYAIKGQEELRKDQFSLAMQIYSGKEVDYKSYISRNYKKYLGGYNSTLVTEDFE